MKNMIVETVIVRKPSSLVEYARYVGLVNPEFTPLETENKEWGCWHELNIALNDNETLIKQYRNEISVAINNLSNLPAEEVKKLLDSRFGQHLVDEFFDTISNKESFITAFCNKYTKSDIQKAKSYYC